jgi:3-phenylpropionate/trans-cinnamate dioxygenase ferredoxin reductase component
VPAQRVVIVGAGLGGLRTAEQLRAAGFADQIVIVGDELHLPYNRPPLSKEGLAGGVDHPMLAFRHKASIGDVTWRLGEVVASADIDNQTVGLGNGSELTYDGLVVATGVRARRLPLDAPLSWRHVVRTLDDAILLRQQLVSSRQRAAVRVVVIGAGFIGCEGAATARTLGCEVHVVDPMAVPLIRPLGVDLGAAIQRRHEAHGVVFHLGRSVAQLTGDETGPHRIELDDSTVLAVDVVVEAVGSIPNVEWLAGNGFDLDDGVRCNQDLHPLRGEQPVPTVVVVGDVARFPNALFDDMPRRVEHWNIPTETAKRAARSLRANITGVAQELPPFAPMPAFWSDQYEVRVQSFGLPGIGGDDIRVLEGDIDGDCAVGYHRDGRLVGVVLLGMTARSVYYRDLIAAAHA